MQKLLSHLKLNAPYLLASVITHFSEIQKLQVPVEMLYAFMSLKS